MKKHTSKLIALVLALCLCLSLSVSAFAAEIDSSGGSGSTPVNLSSTSDGTEGGDPSAHRHARYRSHRAPDGHVAGRRRDHPLTTARSSTTPTARCA